MNIETRIDGKRVAIYVGGSVTPPDSGLLRDTIVSLIEEGHRHLVLDFGEVSDIDSAGLGALVAAITLARRSGAEIRIENGSGPTGEILSRTRLF